MDIKELYRTLNQRKRPEDVAQMIAELLGDDLNPREKRTLAKAAKGSLKNMFWGYTSMMQEFAAAVGAEKQIRKTIEIFNLKIEGNIDYDNALEIEKFIKEVSPMIFKDFGNNNFLSDRLNKYERKAKGMDMSKRSYNKKWRLLKRLEKKLLKFRREVQKVEFTKIGKHGLAHRIEFEDFAKDLNTACFIAYFNARCNLRSVFTNQSQVRAFDEISKMLLNRCKKSEANWWAIAHIYTGGEVLTHLNDEQKGALLGKWTGILQEISNLLEEVWKNSKINRKTMVVKRGDDSTTWNNTANAWNKARDMWVNLIYALGLQGILEKVCFGKVLRLMAADVVAWHLNTGGKLDPNTHVWNKIPLPWQVFAGKAECNREMVEAACAKAGLDAAKSGWVAPRKHGVEKFAPTPELVHGVEVANPFLAKVLRKEDFFSGKKKSIYC